MIHKILYIMMLVLFAISAAFAGYQGILGLVHHTMTKAMSPALILFLCCLVLHYRLRYRMGKQVKRYPATVASCTFRKSPVSVEVRSNRRQILRPGTDVQSRSSRVQRVAWTDGTKADFARLPLAHQQPLSATQVP